MGIHHKLCGNGGITAKSGFAELVRIVAGDISSANNRTLWAAVTAVQKVVVNAVVEAVAEADHPVSGDNGGTAADQPGRVGGTA